MMAKWNYDYDPLDGIVFVKDLSKLRKEIANNGSSVFRSIIRDFIVNNNHRVTLVMYPSDTLESEIADEERNRLNKIKAKLNKGELQSIIDKSKIPRAQCIKHEQSSIIPTLTIQDIKSTPVEYPIEVQDIAGSNPNEASSSIFTIIRHPLKSSTMELCYVDICMDISAVPF